MGEREEEEPRKEIWVSEAESNFTKQGLLKESKALLLVFTVQSHNWIINEKKK